MIESFRLKTDREVRGTDAKEGQRAFAVKKGTLYFIWSYTDEAFARQMDAKLTGPRDSTDEAANWRKSPSATVVSDRKSFH